MLDRFHAQSLCLMLENGAFTVGEKATLLGIGSGLSSLMMAIEWKKEIK